MEMHSVPNLATLQTPLLTFFPSKKSSQTLFSVWEPLVLLCERRVLLYQRAHTLPPISLSLSLSLSLSVSALFSERWKGATLSVKRRYYVASLILHASIDEITAQLLSLSYVYLISYRGLTEQVPLRTSQVTCQWYYPLRPKAWAAYPSTYLF